MPPRNWISGRSCPGRGSLLVGMFLLTCLFSSGCNRLSFVRPNMERQGYERVAPDIVVSDSPASKAATSARLNVRIAQRHLGEGDLGTAEKLARQALKSDPGSESAHTLLALIRDRQGQPGQAGEHYRRAAELAPTSGGMLNNYGTWLCSNGRATESLEWFDRALADRSYQTPAVALANAGACAQQARLDDRAEAYSRAAIEIDANNPVALSTLAERAFMAGRHFEARAFSERRLAVMPINVQTLLLASQIEEKLGDNKAAARYVQRMRAEFPSTGSDTGDDGKP